MNLIQASDRDPARVVIAGGGVAALEALLTLRALTRTHACEITLLAPEAEFHGRPLSVAEPFGISQPRHLELAAIASDHNARFVRDSLGAVHTTRRVLETTSGRELGYDSLLIATGAEPRPVLPGALTFRGGRDVPAFRALLEQIDSGQLRSIAFAVPRQARWSLPLYELALMTAARAAAHGQDVRISFVTHEAEPLSVFGRRISFRMRELLTGAGITLRTRTTPLVAQPGRLFISPGQALAADRTVALAKLLVPPIPGIPQGGGGFIPVDDFGRVDGLRHVYAAGDVTWFPVKQGGIAAQMADTAAAAIAADLGAPVVPEPFHPVLRGILLTGEAPQYLRTPEPGAEGEVADSPLWMPVAKIAGRRLGAYLAGHEPDEPEELTDVEPARDHQAALELALEAANAAAGWNDPKDALRWLGVAEGLNVALPMEYADKRREWSRLTKEGAR